MANDTKVSILKSIRQAIGLDPEDNSFDNDLIMHINTFLGILTQAGAGNETVTVTGETETWDDFLLPELNTPSIFQSVQTYIFINVKMVFDPPTPTSQQYMKQASDEILWRISVAENEAQRRKEETTNGL